jgi:hypothetical protein
MLDPEPRRNRHPGAGRGPEPHGAARAALGPGLRRDDEVATSHPLPDIGTLSPMT